MERSYFLIYLVYGFAMINMGIFCLKEKSDSKDDLSLIKSLKYLGLFGFIHGITELITVLIIADIYPDLFEVLYHLDQILKALSFTFLLIFGIDLLIKKRSRLMLTPFLLFISYAVGYLLLTHCYGLDYHLNNPLYNTLLLRYGFALGSGIVAAIAMFKEALVQPKLMAKRYRQLAWVILINGLLEGLLVQRFDFFPANIINRDMFDSLFKSQSLLLKAVIALLINYLLVKVLDTFSWEKQQRLKSLEKHKIITQERQRVSMDIHDGIIQSLYVAGLKTEYLIMNQDLSDLDLKLKEIKDKINETIDQTRAFMISTSQECTNLSQLKEAILEIIERLADNQPFTINLDDQVVECSLVSLSGEKLTQISYIIQEALTNVVKH